jgi:hypothetical protein
MSLGGLHLLVTCQCNRECDHCFVWGGPWAEGAMTLAQIREILRQAAEVPTVREIWFEGGEPFLYYPLVVEGVRAAAAAGFRPGIVSNAYWARTEEDAAAWLRPLAGTLQSLLVSCDPIHWSGEAGRLAANAQAGAKAVGLPLGVMAIPDAKSGPVPGILYRGRAAEKLAPKASTKPWQGFDRCTAENLRDPARVHVDHLGNLHACQGIVIGNLFRTPLREIVAAWNPDAHPILGLLLAGGPAELARRLNPPARDAYVDACHLCYETRRALRADYPEILAPAQMYGQI